MGVRATSAIRPHSSAASTKFWLLAALVSILAQGVLCETEPTESQCRTYIEKALKEKNAEQKITEAVEEAAAAVHENILSEQVAKSEASSLDSQSENDDDDDEGHVQNDEEEDDDDEDEEADDKTKVEEKEEEERQVDKEDSESVEKDGIEEETESAEKDGVEEDSAEVVKDESLEEADKTKEQDDNDDDDDDKKDTEASKEQSENEDKDKDDDDDDDELERPIEVEVREIEITDDDDDDDDEKGEDDEKDKDDEDDDKKTVEESDEKLEDASRMDKSAQDDGDKSDEKEEDENVSKEIEKKEKESEKTGDESEEMEAKEDDDQGRETLSVSPEMTETTETPEAKKEERKLEVPTAAKRTEAEKSEQKEETEVETTPEEEELIQEVVIPENLRTRGHIDDILKLDESSESSLEKIIDGTLKSLKVLYDNAIKPLEMLYKYRDLSNRHFGDPEIFSKPLVLFMGPWSGGKSSTINYLLNNEFSHTSLRTGAEPSPAYFNILMHGEEEEVLDGTQLAADWTFSGLQKFGQGLLDRLKGIKLPNKLLEKVNIVEIPGILEIRKQVQRLFPFNDACQWFIDRADIIFLVYDPSKLDVGPETEAILDQLKGREYQTRIILNKADQVKPEELMRVQGTLIWNLSPLMSSTEPPIMYTTSLWSMPYESGAPTRLLLAQERAFLRDMREAIDKRVENKISSARRFAVRVRNHAKMVDCYLTTYYNHKSIFGNRKRISDDIVENPQKYHIYEGLSTLTNISRYDLPDPDIYRDFFKINPLYDFQKLSETCTYFRGCPINKLDVSIAYDLPELVGKYRKMMDTARDQPQKGNNS